MRARAMATAVLLFVPTDRLFRPIFIGNFRRFLLNGVGRWTRQDALTQGNAIPFDIGT